MKENWSGDINVSDMTASVEIGRFVDGNPFILFKYLRQGVLCGEYLGWKVKEEVWESAYAGHNQLSLKMSNLKIRKGSREEYYMLDRIRRLMKGEPVGMLVNYPNTFLFKPINPDEFRPTDAYLKGKDLEEYMTFENIFYERECLEGTSDIILAHK